MIANNKKEEIIEKITSRGYEIVEERTVKFTPEMAREFYDHKKNEVLFIIFISTSTLNYFILKLLQR